ncbi:MAG: SCO family protein [Polyangiaceae bacterium]
MIRWLSLVVCFVLAAACSAPPKPTETKSATPAAKPRDDGKWKKLFDAWEYPAPLPDFELVDQDGRPFRLHSLLGSYTFVSFAFSSCQVVAACPTTMKKMAEVQVLWLANSQSESKKLRLVTFTLDPENDTPKVLREYGRLNGADFSVWTLATGPYGLMTEGLPSLLGIMAMRDQKGTLNHGVKAALLDPELRSLREWEDNGFSAEDVVGAVLRHRADAGASTDAGAPPN